MYCILSVYKTLNKESSDVQEIHGSSTFRPEEDKGQEKRERVQICRLLVRQEVQQGEEVQRPGQEDYWTSRL